MQKNTGKTKILIIEDDRGLCSTIKNFLEERGFEVTCAYDGKEGFDMLVTAKPDLLILDIMLPGLDGRDILSKMRQLDSVKEVPVIVLSAKDEQYDRDIGLELGAYEYITKPYNSLILLKQIRSILEKSKMRRAA